jgi:hypothetical protein
MKRAGARKLLQNWHDTKGLTSAQRLLGSWQQQPFAAPYEKIQRDNSEHHHFLAEAVRECELFDCLLIGGWRPNENELSDVVAALLSPTWGHGFWRHALKNLLVAIHEKLPKRKSTRIRNVAEQISKRIDADSGIVVGREHWGENSRADIDVYGSGFFLRIEHKTRYGAETPHSSGVAQTERLFKDAAAYAALLGIAPENVLAVLLSPNGQQASSSDFCAISYREFATSIRKAITDSIEGIDRLPRAAESILGFLNFYGRGI